MYREARTAVPGVVLWTARQTGTGLRPVLPDGCLDVIWDGSRLSVAGPDSAARWLPSVPGRGYVALRCAAGTGPALLGVAADELRDTSPALAEVWPAADARRLEERVAADPVGALRSWLAAAAPEPDPLGWRLLRLASAGAGVGRAADELGLSARQVHRRCLGLFGYGPQHLVRVGRLQRALGLARRGLPLARVAALAGYADQAHLSRDVRALAGTTPTALLRATARPEDGQAPHGQAPHGEAPHGQAPHGQPREEQPRRAPGQGEPVGGSAAKRSTGTPSGSWTTA